MITATETIRFQAGDGGPLLEGRVRRPASAEGAVAVLCHPHPASGGHMDVWLLPTIAQRLADEGWSVLRFNIRGVGGSEPGPGAWDGRAETADLDGALTAARGLVAQAGRTAVIGWSFGALLGLLHGPGDARVTDWVGIAPPTRGLVDPAMVPPPLEAVQRWTARRAVVVGAHDQFFPPAEVDVLAPDVVHVMADADHFLFDRDREVADLVAGTLRGTAR